MKPETNKQPRVSPGLQLFPFPVLMNKPILMNKPKQSKTQLTEGFY